jgi:hypothetical protein
VHAGNSVCPGLIFLQKLDEYQEQPYLLDPFLNKMVEPVVEELKNGIRVVLEQEEVNEQKSTRLYQLATLMYWYSKTRGMKSIGENITEYSVLLPHRYLLHQSHSFHTPSRIFHWPYDSPSKRKIFCQSLNHGDYAMSRLCGCP